MRALGGWAANRLRQESGSQRDTPALPGVGVAFQANTEVRCCWTWPGAPSQRIWGLSDDTGLGGRGGSLGIPSPWLWGPASSAVGWTVASSTSMLGAGCWVALASSHLRANRAPAGSLLRSGCAHSVTVRRRGRSWGRAGGGAGKGSAGGGGQERTWRGSWGTVQAEGTTGAGGGHIRPREASVGWGQATETGSLKGPPSREAFGG